VAQLRAADPPRSEQPNVLARAKLADVPGRAEEPLFGKRVNRPLRRHVLVHAYEA